MEKEKIVVNYKKNISYKEIEMCAVELASLTTVLDPDGVAYRSYNFPVIEKYLMVKYFTDMNVDEMTTLSDWEKLFDEVEIDRFRLEGWGLVYEIYDLLFESTKLKHEKTSSLSYKISKMLESVLADEDIVKILAESRDVNEKMIDLIRKAEFGKKSESNTLLKFAKK